MTNTESLKFYESMTKEQRKKVKEVFKKYEEVKKED